MASDEGARQAAAREAAMKTMGLFILLERAGGSLTFTKEEYDAVIERYGGSTNVVLHFEHVGTADGRQTIQLTLGRRPPSNAELVS